MASLKIAASAPLTATEPRPKRQWRTRYNQVMKLVRRAHLYAGLFMTPWVFLYGFTALLFNHPDVFPDAKVVRFGPAYTAGTALANVPRPAALAEQVIKVLNSPGDETKKGISYRLVRPAEARYERDYFASVVVNGQEHFVRFDLAKGEGTVRSQAKTTDKPAPFVRKGGIKLDPPPLKGVGSELLGVLERLGISNDKKVDRSFAPDLSFLMEGDGRTWRVEYNPQNGQLSGHPEAVGNPLSARSYLLRLHLAHTYPGELNARWFWALAVDAMFVSMVGWGITGLLMWWQMKNVRKIGIVVLAASAVVATAVAIGMHRLLTT